MKVEELKPTQNVISLGTSMSGKNVIVKGILHYDAAKHDFVLHTGGIKIMLHPDQLGQFYPDTKDNRKFLNLIK